jgi:hypothetical protein
MFKNSLFIVLFTLFTIVFADSFTSVFSSEDDAQSCYIKNSAYINKLSKSSSVNGTIIFMQLKNVCSNSISEEFKAVCKNVEYNNCL